MVFNHRLVGSLGQYTKCVSELCDVFEASCSPAALVRLLQYYSSWAQLRDTVISNWTPLGEGTESGIMGKKTQSVTVFSVLYS